MPIKVAFVRGINVGGHKKFPKAEQLQMVQQLGFAGATVYLHTGNWIFSSSNTNASLEKIFEDAIEKAYGWKVAVIVRSASEITEIVNGCPFSEETKTKSYFVLLKNRPLPEHISKIEQTSYPNEEFYITGEAVYFYPSLGAGKSKLSTNFFENKLHVAATARNYNTMTKILALVIASTS